MTDFRLHRQGQEYYTLPDLAAETISGPVVVPVTGWEASFDRGLSWHPSQAHPDQGSAPCWLVHGPDYPGSGDTAPTVGALIVSAVVPLIRLRDTPETTIEPAPWVLLWA